MGAVIFIAGSTLALVLGPLLGLALLPSRRTRKAAFFLFLLPSTAAGAGLFGFWSVLRLLYGHVSPQREIELSFYLGWVAFYALGLALALALLLVSTHSRPGALLKSASTGIAASFIVLACLAVTAMLWGGIASRHGTGVVGWDPISVLGSTSAWRVLPPMLLVFALFFVWSAQHVDTLRTDCEDLTRK